MEIDDMNPPQYIFVNGNGDDDHAKGINSVADKYRVVSMIFDPDARAENKGIVVLMERKF
jgi:hypothetical protein